MNLVDLTFALAVTGVVTGACLLIYSMGRARALTLTVDAALLAAGMIALIVIV